MREFLQFLLRSFAAAFTSVLVWAISFLALEVSMPISILSGLLAGIVVFLSFKWYFRHQFLRKNGLTRREYNYIKKNLKEAKVKISRLQKALIKGRSLSSMKQNFEILRIVNRIYVITKREPKRFFLAEKFYYTHLDSLVELTEKYAFLNSQPSKTLELSNSLQETRFTINQLADSLEKDLYTVLENDIDDLHFELDVAKQELKKRPIEIDERRQ